MNVAELVSDITGVSARNQFYIYGGLLLGAIVLSCIVLKGAAPLI